MGAGGSGENTAILAELLRQKAKSAVITVTDPEAVQQAVKAGVGNNAILKVGGKKDPKVYGDPVQIEGRVRVISDERFVPTTKTNVAMVERGLTAVIDCGGIEVILTTLPPLIFEANYFRSLGIDPTERKILVCKSESQHHEGFAHIARAIIDVDGPGYGTQDLSKLRFTKVRRPIFPLDSSANNGDKR
jgi:microcystin degradation protein MlrC